MKNLLSGYLHNIWNSPTLNTWLSYSTKALSLLLVLPLILSKFSTPEVTLWYLFATIISLQGLADMGFKMTFIRMIAYAYGGAKDIVNYSESQVKFVDAIINWELVGRIYSVMHYIYIRLTILFAILLSTLGTWSLIKPISLVYARQEAWIAWSLIILISCVKFSGTIYSNYLEGLNKIALVRRWEALTSIGAILSSIFVLITFKNLLWLVISNQIWVIIIVIRNFILCKKVENGKFLELNINHPFDKKLFMKIWNPAWRSGISGFMSNGLSGITSLIYAQIGNTTNVAAYLLALRIINQIRDVSTAPFYSKIPMFSRLVAQGKMIELKNTAQIGMFWSNLIFIVGALSFSVVAPFLLNYINSEVKFIDINLWLLLTLAYFVHRYGAMHIQLYSSSNHIISHIADGISGAIFIVVTLILIKPLDLYAIPIGLLAGYLGFYAWYSGLYSYRYMGVKFWNFEGKASIIPLMILIVYFIFYLIFDI